MSSNYPGHPDQWFGPISYAQHGDDMFILNLFFFLGVKKGRYLDLGAHHPEHISNTALMYQRGWRGVNVDASEAAISLFNDKRPHDRNILLGVGPTEGSGEFLMFADNHGRNTFSKKEPMSWGGQVVKSKIVPIKTLPYIIEKYCDGQWPDFINMDIEGFDTRVLLSLDPNNKPSTAVWCIECRREEEVTMKEVMLSLGYQSLCKIAGNIIFVRDDLIGKVR